MLDLTDPSEYDNFHLGALPSTATPQQLYIDIVKRSGTRKHALRRPATLFYDGKTVPVVAERFDLSRRVLGEDTPSLAHTMIGIRRLDNIANCVEDILANNVEGDVLEAGVLRGVGDLPFSMPRTHGTRERRVFVCDTFEDQVRMPLPVALLLQAIAHVPGLAWKRPLLRWGQSLAKTKSFPADATQPMKAPFYGVGDEDCASIADLRPRRLKSSEVQFCKIWFA